MSSLVNNNDPKSAKNTLCAIAPPNTRANIILYDERTKQCYFDIMILDRKYRFFGFHRCEDIYATIRRSVMDTVNGQLPFVIMNGTEVVPRNRDSLIGVVSLDKHLRVSFDQERFPHLSWSVLFERACMTANMQVQAGADTQDAGYKSFVLMVKLVTKQMVALQIPDFKYWIDVLNNLAIAYRSFSRCNAVQDYIDEFQVFYRILLGRSAMVDFSEKIDAIFAPSVVQADSTEILHALRESFDMVRNITENKVVKKLQNLFSYALVQGYLKHIGLELNDEDYSKFEQRQLTTAFSSKKGFFFEIMDTALFVAERLNAWYVTGDFDNFLHSEKLYVDWLREADRLLNLAAFTNNLTALDNTNFKFKADLESAIEKGKAYVKFTAKSAGTENVAIRRKLCSLELLHNTEITRRAAQIERKAPFGVLIAGHSSIAKSAFTKVVYNAYGSLFDLDRSDAGCYCRNSFDDFWSGFNSSQWCIRMDDIAFLNPSKTAEVDNSIIEMLGIVNNVPFVPNQASLEAKGTTPVLAKLVVATTNTLHLNTTTYFACPLAVNRRLPYVVNLKPKQEYLHSNQIFVDPSKLKCDEGDFPNFWEIEVMEIHPVIGTDKVERAEFKTLAVFTDINDFVKHFLTAAQVHEGNQTRAVEKNADMAKIDICKDCLIPLGRCPCMQVQSLSLTPMEDYTVWVLMYIFSVKWFVSYVVYYLSRFRLTRYPVYAAINHLPPRESIALYARLNEWREDVRIRRLVAGLTMITVALASYQGYKSVQKWKATSQESEDKAVQKRKVTPQESEDKVVPEYISETTETAEFGFTTTITATEDTRIAYALQADKLLETQIEKEEKQNVWYVANPTISTFEIPVASRSLATASNSDIRDILDKNCVAVNVRANGRSMTLRGIFVTAQKLLLPAHAFAHVTAQCVINVIDSDITKTHNTNYEFTLNKQDLVVMSGMDLCMIEVSGVPPKKSVLRYFLEEEICPSNGFELMRQTDGTLDLIPFYNLQKELNVPVAEIDSVVDVYIGTSAQETAPGMCGSLCVGTTPRGPVIMGLHLLGLGNKVGFLCVKLAHVEALMKHPNFRSLNVQGGGSPMLSCSKRKYTIQPLHHRSLLRYLPKVNANVYGTLDGFRGNQRSRVCATPLQKEILVKYDREVAHGAPFLGSYHGVKQNVEHMVKPQNNYNKMYLRKCVEAYSNDIITGLPAQSLRELIPLSTHAAINGLPGVKFIDGINRSTSMGFPYNTTKKQFLVECKSEEYPDGVTYTQEVLDEMDVIEKRYAQGLRAYPIFSGHNKDEAVPIAKVISKKCRLFVGAPAAWSAVVRKKLLPFVRVVQKNQLLFEAGPGLVCQSREWDNVYKYLTQFGLHRIIAGDYGKFDKRMLADFILAAFDIIVNILRHAGWDETELLYIMCIGYDIAFPCCAILGDLIEFFGTNPSGHPLTVILNSIVNSLYLRYGYISLNPEHTVTDFKKHVAAFTYGDDNAMGVSTLCDWFNHTSLQTVLAAIGVEYTMADKTSESVPFININDTSFLKRTWRWDERMQCFLCPLDEDSIFKSLTMWVPSDSIDKYAQFVAVASSAVQEYFFYGEEKFSEMRSFFVELLDQEPYKFYITSSTFPTYEQLEERFNANSVDIASIC